MKQGDALSPVLFAIDTDEGLEKLRKGGDGCYMGNKFMVRLVYHLLIILCY